MVLRLASTPAVTKSRQPVCRRIASKADDSTKLNGVSASGYLRSNATDIYSGGTLGIDSNSNEGAYWGFGLKYSSSSWRHTNANSWGWALRNAGGNGLEINICTAAGGSADAVANFRTLRIGGAAGKIEYDGALDLSGGITMGGELNMMGPSDTDKFLDVRLGAKTFAIRGTSQGDANHQNMAHFERTGAVKLLQRFPSLQQEWY